MSLRMDLYVEKILSRMVLDDAQRVEMDREIRAHVAEAVAEGQRQGLTPEQAEDEAILQFGQPSHLARAFQPAGGLAWLVFERAAAAACAIYVMRVFYINERAFMEGGMPALAAWALALGLYAFVLLLAVRPLLRRVEVNGGILLRQFPFPATKLRFDDIRHARFEKGHLFGRPVIVLELEKGKVGVRTDLPGMRACGLALDLFVGDKVEPRLREYLRRARLRVRAESLTFRVTLTSVWCALGFVWIWAGWPLWQGQGVEWALLVPALTCCAVVQIQARKHVDRARAGLCHLLTCVLLFSCLGILGALVTTGNALWIRCLLLLFLLCVSFAVFLLWWPGRRVAILAFAGVFSFLGVSLWWTVPQPYRLRTELLDQVPLWPVHFRWTQGGGAVWLAANKDAVATGYNLTLTEVQPDGSRAAYYVPGPGDWELCPTRTGRKVVLTRRKSESDGRIASYLAVLVEHQGVGSLDHLPRNWWNFGEAGEDCWSPDGAYLLARIGSDASTATQAEQGKHQAYTGAIEMKSGHATRLEGSASAVQWLDDRQCVTAKHSIPSPHELLADPSLVPFVDEWQANVETGECALLKHWPLAKDVTSFRILPSSSLLLCYQGLNVGAVRDSVWLSPRLLDWRTGEQVMLPPIYEDIPNHSYDWNPGSQSLVYVNQPWDGSPECRLLVVSAKGEILARKDFPSGTRFISLRLSPDGEKVLYSCHSEAARFAYGITRMEVWDTVSGETIPVSQLGVVEAFLFAFARVETFQPSLPLWAPDSKSIALDPRMDWRHAGSGQRHSQMLFRVWLGEHDK